MSAASNMKKENTDSMLWHAETPSLVVLAEKAMQLREAIYKNSGILWKSKQWRPKSKLPVEMVLGTALAFARRRESLQDAPPAIVRRGEFPINDVIMDDFLDVLRKEASDMIRCLEASEINNTVSVGGGEVTTAASMASIEGGSSSVQLIPVAASSKGLFKWQVDKLMDWMRNNNYNPSPDWDAIDELHESTKMKPSQIVAWTREVGESIAKLRSAGTDEKRSEVITIDDDDDDDNDESSVPELAEDFDLDGDAWHGPVLDALPEPSAAEDDEDSVLELAEEEYADVDVDDDTWNALIAELAEVEDAWTGLEAEDVLGPSTAVSHNVPRDVFEIKDEAYLESLCSEPLESLESLILELGFEFADSASSDCLRENFGVTCGSSMGSDVESFDELNFEIGGLESPVSNNNACNTVEPNPTPYEDELFALKALSVYENDGCWFDGEGDLQRPCKRSRSDSLDSLFACLLD